MNEIETFSPPHKSNAFPEHRNFFLLSFSLNFIHIFDHKQLVCDVNEIIHSNIESNTNRKTRKVVVVSFIFQYLLLDIKLSFYVSITFLFLQFSFFSFLVSMSLLLLVPVLLVLLLYQMNWVDSLLLHSQKCLSK